MYQPKRINGRDVGQSRRLCAERYDAISQELSGRWKKGDRFTVLDFGAHAGYFSQRLIEDWPGVTVVAVDNHPPLHKVAQSRLNVYLERVPAADIPKLGWYDVTLALSVWHHMEDWVIAIDAMRMSSSCLIYEVPHPAEKLPRAVADLHNLYESARRLDGKLLCSTPGYDPNYYRDVRVAWKH